MFRFIKRFWLYVTAAANVKFDEKADPKIQLEQAITEAKAQHSRLTNQAASVLAHATQCGTRLKRKEEELDKANGSARQALLMAEEAAKKGDQPRAEELTRSAAIFADRIIGLEAEIADLKVMLLGATEAADQAKAAVATNSSLLQRKLSEKQKLLSQLDQAKMQEQMNKAMSSLSATVGEDVPTFGEIREKIETRHARAQGVADLQGQEVGSHMLEIEAAAQNAAANTRLAQLRAELGLGATTEASEAPAAEEVTEPAQTPAPGQ